MRTSGFNRGLRARPRDGCVSLDEAERGEDLGPFAILLVHELLELRRIHVAKLESALGRELAKRRIIHAFAECGNQLCLNVRGKTLRPAEGTPPDRVDRQAYRLLD